MEREKILGIVKKDNVKNGEFEQQTTAGSAKYGLYISMGFATLLVVIQMIKDGTINWAVISAICMMTAVQNVYDTRHTRDRGSLIVGIIFSVLTILTFIVFLTVKA